MNRRSFASMWNPWPGGATHCALTRADRNCDPPFVMKAMAIITTIAHGRAQRTRRQVNGLDAFIKSSRDVSALCDSRSTNWPDGRSSSFHAPERGVGDMRGWVHALRAHLRPRGETTPLKRADGHPRAGTRVPSGRRAAALTGAAKVGLGKDGWPAWPAHGARSRTPSCARVRT